MSELFVRHRPPNDYVTLEIPKDISLRRLDNALRGVHISATIDRIRRVVYLQLNQVFALKQIGGGFSFHFHESVEKLFSYRPPSLSLEEQKEIVDTFGDVQSARQAIQDITHVDILDDHQISAVAVASHPGVDGLCIFDEQGLGKTVQALFSFHALKERGQVERAIVLCPKNMVMEWANDCQRLLGEQYVIATAAGSVMQKRQVLTSSADIYVTNFETVTSLNQVLQNVIQRSPLGCLLVVDESFYVKNREAHRTRALLALRTYVKKCIVLCGTPAPNHPSDLVTQMDLASAGRTFLGVSISKDRAEAAKVISDVIERKGVYVRRLKQVVMPELPGKKFTTIQVRLTDAQAALYRSALLDLQLTVSQTNEDEFQKSKLSFFAKRSQLLQICSTPHSIYPEFSGETAKDLALDQLLEELISVRNEKVILWSFYRDSVERLLHRYSKYNPVRIDGEVPNINERREAIRKFQEDDVTMLVVANPAAAGAGITLHRARIAIYESMSNQAAHYLQSLDRIHRRGQGKEVEYFFLVSEGTLEPIELDRFKAKELSSRDLLGDPPSQHITRDVLLEELNLAVELFANF